MGEIFEIIFNDAGVITTIELEHEPVGYDAIDFNLNQENDRFGRDWLFAGNGQIMLELISHSNYDAFVKMEEMYQKYGFETDAKFVVKAGTGSAMSRSETFVGNIDFLAIEYNGHDTFKFSVNQETEEALVKKRSELVVNLFAHQDLDGNLSVPAPYKNVLLPAKQVYRESIWENLSGNKIISFSDIGRDIPFNYSSNPTKSEIRNSLSWLDSTTSGWQSALNNKLIEAKTDILNLDIDVDFNGSKIIYDGSGGGTASAVMTMVYMYGPKPNNQAEYNNMTLGIIVPKVSFKGGQPKTVDLKNTNIKIPLLKTGEIVIIYGVVDFFSADPVLHYNNVKFSAKAYEQNFDIVTKCISVYDAAKKIVHDISGLDVVFPLAQSGVLKSNYLFSGNMVRGIVDEWQGKPFNVSFDDLQKWFPELNLDYEIMSNKQVYIGKREDYYTDNEIDVIDNVAFDSYNETQNPRYALNKFAYKYSKYQSQKENTEEDTEDIVHGEAEYHINNIQVETTKSIEVNFVRDPFLLQETINKALQESEIKANQDDETIFILDTANMTISDYNKNKTSVLYHRIDANKLVLSNDGSFRWDLLGFDLGSTFEVVTPQNKGVYRVTSISSSVIELEPTGSTSNPTQVGDFFTAFKYILDSNEVTLKPYVYTGWMIGVSLGNSIVQNVRSPETFANLRYSIGLNIRNYYTDFISTAVKTNINPKQIKYINNSKYENNAFSPKHYENADISTSTPILDTKVIETKLIMDFTQYLRICRVLRSQSRGFVRTFNPKGEPICLYPQDMKAIYKTSGLKEVSIKGEVRNIPSQINITKSANLYNIWIYRFESFEVKIEGDYLIFLDPNRVPFYRRSHYSDIKVNGLNYTSALDVVNSINAL